mmetsp:Transcript_19630/g.45121  ORF Transcript_19630/g.45121 Transcript_19630/m.45121 type:complete len:301 (-) Transcript_19630:183-1085(-)
MDCSSSARALACASSSAATSFLREGVLPSAASVRMASASASSKPRVRSMPSRARGDAARTPLPTEVMCVSSERYLTCRSSRPIHVARYAASPLRHTSASSMHAVGCSFLSCPTTSRSRCSRCCAGAMLCSDVLAQSARWRRRAAASDLARFTCSRPASASLDGRRLKVPSLFTQGNGSAWTTGTKAKPTKIVTLICIGYSSGHASSNAAASVSSTKKTPAAMPGSERFCRKERTATSGGSIPLCTSSLARATAELKGVASTIDQNVAMPKTMDRMRAWPVDLAVPAMRYAKMTPRLGPMR